MARRCAPLSARRAAVYWAVPLVAFGGCGRTPAPAVAPAAAVQAALDRRIALDVADEPLEVVLATLLEDAGVPFVNRAERRWPTDYRRDEPVTLRLEDARLESALRWLLLPRGLDYVVGDAGLEIVGRDEPGYPVRTYIVSDILALGNPGWGEADLAEAITELIDPVAWETSAGGGHIEVLPGAVAIAHSPEVHRRVERLLADIRRAADPHAQDHDLPASSPAEERLSAALEATTSIDLPAADIEAVVAWLRETHGLNVVADVPTLTDWSGEGGLRLTNVPLRQALDLLAAQRDLVWHVADEALGLSLDFNVAPPMTTVVYPLRIAVEDVDIGSQRSRGRKDRRTLDYDAEEVADLVRGMIAPGESWTKGACRAMPVPGGLAVTKSRAGHVQTAELLARLEAALDPYRLSAEEPPSPAAARLEEMLAQTVTVGWFKEPLLPALLELLQVQCGIENVVVEGELEGTFSRAEATIAVSDVSLRAALGLILEPRELAWINDSGVLRIATAARARQAFRFRCYRAAGVEAEALIEVVTSHVTPLRWDETGGDAVVQPYPGGIVVKHTDSGHRHIERLLALWKQRGSEAFYAPPADEEPPQVGRLRAALASPVTLDARGRPLGEVLDELARRHELQIVRDLAAAGLEQLVEPAVWKTPVEGTFYDVQLGNVLRRLLAPHGLDWVVRHEVLMIVWKEAAERDTVTRAHRVPLIDVDANESDDLLPALESFVGDRLREALTALPDGILVTQTPEKHRRTEQFLAMLQESPPAATPAEERIARQLLAPAGAAIVDAPLGMALELLSRRHRVSIVVGASFPPLRQSVALPEGLTLAAALDRLCLRFNLDWAVRDETIVVARHDDETLSEMRVYRSPRASIGALAAGGYDPFLGFAARAMGDRTFINAWLVGPNLVVRQSRRSHAALERMLEADDAAVARAAAISMLPLHIYPPALTAWSDALSDSSPLVRSRAAFLLAEGAAPEFARYAAKELEPARAVAMLTALLESKAAGTQAAAAQRLGEIGSPASAAAPRIGELIKTATSTGNPVLLEPAIAAYERLGGSSAVPLAELLVLEYDYTVMHRALLQLDRLGARAAPATRALGNCLRKHADSLSGEAICRTLGNIGPGAADAVPALAALLAEGVPHRECALSACEALGAIGSRPDVAVPALLAMAAEDKFTDSPLVRAAACRALGEFPGEAERIVPALTAAAADPHEVVAFAAAEALAQLQMSQDRVEPDRSAP